MLLYEGGREEGKEGFGIAYEGGREERRKTS